MRKRILSITLAILLMLTAANAGSITAEAAGKTTVYETNAIYITKFLESKGKLTVKAKHWGSIAVTEKKRNKGWVRTAERALTGKSKELGEKKLTYKIAKNCKWSWCDTGRNSGKSSYSRIRKNAKQAREAFCKYGVDASYGVVQIFVKNKKVVRVNIFGS